MLFGIYVLVFAACVVVRFVAPEHLRWPLVALGGLVVLQGVCIVFNLFGATDDVTESARNSRWVAPAFESRGVVRLQGLFAVGVGIAFAVIAFGMDSESLTR